MGPTATAPHSFDRTRRVQVLSRGPKKRRAKAPWAGLCHPTGLEASTGPGGRAGAGPPAGFTQFGGATPADEGVGGFQWPSPDREQLGGVSFGASRDETSGNVFRVWYSADRMPGASGEGGKIEATDSWGTDRLAGFSTTQPPPLPVDSRSRFAAGGHCSCGGRLVRLGAGAQTLVRLAAI